MKYIGYIFVFMSVFTFNSIRGDIKGDYLPASKAVPQGKAPKLKVKQLSDSNGVRSFVLVFSRDDEILGGLVEFANKYNVKSASLTALGSFVKATTGWYDMERQAFKLHPMEGAMEITSLIGNITEFNGKPSPHVHFSAGNADGFVQGGHMIEAYTYATVEMFVTAYPTPIYKQHQDDTGLNLINLDLTSSPESKK